MNENIEKNSCLHYHLYEQNKKRLEYEKHTIEIKSPNKLFLFRMNNLDKKIVITNTKTDNKVYSEYFSHPIEYYRLTQNKKYLLLNFSNGSLVVFDLNTRRKLIAHAPIEMDITNQIITYIDEYFFSKDEKYLFITLKNQNLRKIKVFNLFCGKNIFHEYFNKESFFTYSSKSNKISVCENNNEVKLFDLGKNKITTYIKVDNDTPTNTNDVKLMAKTLNILSSLNPPAPTKKKKITTLLKKRKRKELSHTKSKKRKIKK